MNTSTDKLRITSDGALCVLATFIAALALVMFVPPIAQPSHYHEFADCRTLFETPNYWNVMSNAGFLLVGGIGMMFLWCQSDESRRQTFVDDAEWYPYFAYFAGVFLTGVGSAYYHWMPNSNRLIWDRLPMSVMFISLMVAVVSEYVYPKIATYLLAPAVLLGVGSVMNWATRDMTGTGDLRFYLFVQFFPMLFIPAVIHFCRPRYSHHLLMMGSLAWYAKAKLAEMLDAPLYDLTGISGHTIKHLLCGLSTFWVLRMLWCRKPLPEEDSQPNAEG